MRDVRKTAYDLRTCRTQEQAKEQALRSALDKACSIRGELTAVAGALGVSKQYLSDVLHNRRGISSQLLEKLCEVGK